MQYHQRASRSPQQRKKPVYASSDPDEQEPASQQYAGHYAGLHAEDAPFTTAGDVRQHMVQRQTRPAYEDDELEAGQRISSLARRYTGTPMPDGTLYRQGNQQIYVHRGPPPVPQRAGRTTAQHPAAPAFPQGGLAPRPRRRVHWMVWVGLGLMAMLVGYMVLGALGSWLTNHQNDATYGYPRTFQTNAVVGHGDSEAHPSHFIAMNLSRHVIVIEIPGGDVSRAVIYTGPVLLGDGQDLTPVTVSFADMNGDGKPDMQLHILDQTIVFLNNGTKFVPPSSLVSGGSNPSTTGEEDAAGEDTHAPRLS